MEEGQQTRISGEDIVCPSCYLLVQDAKDGHTMCHLLWIPLVCLIHVPIFNEVNLVDSNFVTCLRMTKLFIREAKSFCFHIRRKVGKSFVLELARLCQTFVAVGDSALHSTVMQLLLLQKLCKQSKAKEHSYHLSED